MVASTEKLLVGRIPIKAMSLTRTFLVLLKILFRRPQVVFRGLRAALSLDSWNLPAMGYALFYLAEALLLGDWLRRRGHKHLHIHFGGPVATVGMLAAMAWQVPYSLMIHGPDEFYDVEKFYLRQKVERAHFVLCISDYCRSQVMKVSDRPTGPNFTWYASGWTLGYSSPLLLLTGVMRWRLLVSGVSFQLKDT